jgi:hypothetical protein
MKLNIQVRMNKYKAFIFNYLYDHLERRKLRRLEPFVFKDNTHCMLRNIRLTNDFHRSNRFLKTNAAVLSFHDLGLQRRAIEGRFGVAIKLCKSKAPHSITTVSCAALCFCYTWCRQKEIIRTAFRIVMPGL